MPVMPFHGGKLRIFETGRFAGDVITSYSIHYTKLYDVILEADYCVGEFMKTLEAEGLLENTLIVFSSDNGPVLNDGYYETFLTKIGKCTFLDCYTWNVNVLSTIILGRFHPNPDVERIYFRRNACLSRITSYNVCYTKLLRKGDSVSHKFIELANPPEEEKQYNPDYQTVTKDTLKN